MLLFSPAAWSREGPEAAPPPPVGTVCPGAGCSGDWSRSHGAQGACCSFWTAPNSRDATSGHRGAGPTVEDGGWELAAWTVSSQILERVPYRQHRAVGPAGQGPGHSLRMRRDGRSRVPEVPLDVVVRGSSLPGTPHPVHLALSSCLRGQPGLIRGRGPSHPLGVQAPAVPMSLATTSPSRIPSFSSQSKGVPTRACPRIISPRMNTDGRG